VSSIGSSTSTIILFRGDDAFFKKQSFSSCAF
jgi:hypothetical protein